MELEQLPFNVPDWFPVLTGMMPTPQEQADAINQLNVLRDTGRASPEAVEKGKQKIREQGRKK